MSKSKIIAIVGPTAAGKSNLAIEIARRFSGEIVSCDSMQVYKFMDIGTAKPSKEELNLVRHHMIDVIDPSSSDPFSCAVFTKMAKEVIEDIISRGKTPVLCGGTGLYVDSILTDTDFSNMENDFEYRDYLFKLARENGNEFLHNMLREIDQKSAEETHPNNIKRVIRALEIYKITGKTKSELDGASRVSGSKYDAVILGITYKNRDLLYKRIDDRVDSMIASGLLDETTRLYNSGILREDTTAAQAIGYKELFSVIKGDSDFEIAIEAIKRESRRYAKRQMTWFKRNENIYWLYPDEVDADNKVSTFKIIVNNAFDYLNKHGFCDII